MGGSYLSMSRTNLKLKFFLVRVGSVIFCIGLCPSSNFEHFLSALRLGLGMTDIFTRKTNDIHGTIPRSLVVSRDSIYCLEKKTKKKQKKSKK